MDLDQLTKAFREGEDVIIQPTLESNDNSVREDSESENEICSESENEGEMPLETHFEAPATPVVGPAENDLNLHHKL